MTTGGQPPDGAMSDDGPRYPGAVLVRSPAPPEVPSERCVDVRPGSVAAFDGAHVRLSLWVTDGRRRAPVGWRDRSALVRFVTAALQGTTGATVRFGDRALCRRVLGPAGVGAVERRLAAAARDHGATLVTWTAAPGGRGERAYDRVLDSPVTWDG